MTRNNPILLHLFGLIALLLVALALASCKTTSQVTDTNSKVNNSRLDSIYILQHDSIFIDRYTKGDTVYVDKYHERIKWRDKTVVAHDTTYITKTQIQTVTQYETPKWCWWCLAITALILIVGIIRLVRKFTCF